MVKIKNPGDLTYDGRFKYVFKSRGLRFFVASIVSDILNLDYGYVFKNMKYIDSIFGNTKLNEYRSDVIVAVDKTYLIFEMNRNYYHNLRTNKLLYLSTVYDYYYEDINNRYNNVTAILVNINSFKENEKGIKEFDTSYLFMTNNKVIYTDKVQIREFNLVNGEEKCYNKFATSKLERRLTYLYVTREEENIIREFIKGDDVLMKVDEYRKQIKEGKIPVALTAKERLEREFEEIKAYAIEEATNTGMAQGMAQSTNNIASNMKKDGVNLDIIAKYTGLSIDKIMAL